MFFVRFCFHRLLVGLVLLVGVAGCSLRIFASIAFSLDLRGDRCHCDHPLDIAVVVAAAAAAAAVAAAGENVDHCI